MKKSTKRSSEINKKNNLLEFIKKEWDNLICQTERCQKLSNHHHDTLYLPYPYIVPSKDRFNVMFYWDSYFIIQGLKTEKRNNLIRYIVENCLYEIKKYGRVLNGNRRRWATRSQLPFLTFMIKDVYSFCPDKKWLKKSFALAKKEYNGYWLNRHHLTSTGLSRFYGVNKLNGCHKHAYRALAESSWDMSPRFDECDIDDLLPVDLNCNLYQYEKDFRDLARIFGNEKEAAMWAQKAAARKKVINELLWNEEDGLYYDYNFKKCKIKNIKSLAAYQAMFVGLADKKQAQKLKKNLKIFQTKYGLAACEKNRGYFNRQWRWPIVWAPLQYICYKGLKKYGYRREAKKIADVFINLIYKNWEKTGKIWEKYNGLKGDLRVPFDRYPSQSGFGWTNAVAEFFIKEIYKI